MLEVDRNSAHLKLSVSMSKVPLSRSVLAEFGKVQVPAAMACLLFLLPCSDYEAMCGRRLRQAQQTPSDVRHA
jgi:hypothetical protein